MKDYLYCEKHGTHKECLAGESAHGSNWYCPKCDLEIIENNPTTNNQKQTKPEVEL
jgi:hypothetical protein